MINNCLTQDSCTSVIPNGTDVYIHENDCGVKVDITANRVKSVVIWGHVQDCKRCPIEGAMVKLLKYTGDCCNELRGIAHTYTDCNGFYQFDLLSTSEGRYRVNVSKCACGNERSNSGATCCECCPPNPGNHCCSHCKMEPPEVNNCQKTLHNPCGNGQHTINGGCYAPKQNNVCYY